MNEWIKTWRGGEFLILRSDMKTCILKQPSHLFLKFIYYSFENVSPQNHSVVSWWSAEESRTASLQSLYYRSSSLFVCVDEPKTDEKRRAGGKTEQWSCQSAAKRTVWIQDAASRHQSEAPVLFPPTVSALTISSTSSEGLLFIYSAEWGRGRRVEL